MSSYNVADWLLDRHIAEGNGQRVAVRCDGQDTTYGDLQQQAWRVQQTLAELGLASGDRVAMVVNDEPAFPAWFLGCQRSGVIPAALSTMLRGAELAAIVADSGARLVVLSEEYGEMAGTLTDQCPSVESIIILGQPADGSDARSWSQFQNLDEAPVADTTVDSPAFWLYSSGTTGTPKGVMHRHGSPQATVETYATTVLGINQHDRFLSIAKLFFAYGLGNSLTFPFAVGATAILHPRPPTPPDMVELIASEKPTLFFGSPGFVAAMLDASPPAEKLASLRGTVTAGESLPAAVQTRFSQLTGQPVLDGIGSTELLHIFISNTFEKQVPGSSGLVVDGYQAELRDDAGARVTEADTPGYLHVKGPTAATGYWQKEAETEAAFGDGWVKTGDVYTRSADDCWTFQGRNNDMIKAGGIWVSPAEVESVLIDHPDVLEAAVVGSRDAEGLETTVAYVVPSSGASPDPVVLQQHCRDQMAAFKRPRVIHIVDDLPKTATGKIKRFELRASS